MPDIPYNLDCTMDELRNAIVAIDRFGVEFANLTTEQQWTLLRLECLETNEEWLVVDQFSPFDGAMMRAEYACGGQSSRAVRLLKDPQLSALSSRLRKAFDELDAAHTAYQARLDALTAREP